MPLGDEDDDVLDSNLNIMDTFDTDEIPSAEPFGTFNKTLKGMDIKSMTLKDGGNDASDSGSEEDCLGSDRKLDYTEEVMPAQTKSRFADLDSLPDIKGKDNGRVASKNPYYFDIGSDEIGVENDNDRDGEFDLELDIHKSTQNLKLEKALQF